MSTTAKRKVLVVLVDWANYGRLKPVMRAVAVRPELELHVLEAADHIERNGFNAGARHMRWRSYLGLAGSIYFRWWNRHVYRYRPDWDELFAPFLRLENAGALSP